MGLQMTLLLAFGIIAVLQAFGDIISTMTKGRLPSIFAAAVLFLIGFWTVIPTEVVTATGIDLMTGFSMIAASMGNVGPGFGTVGTAADYAHISPGIKAFCTLFMLLGRLEIFGLIQLFMLKWWR